jgi:hypothetical protein
MDFLNSLLGLAPAISCLVYSSLARIASANTLSRARTGILEIFHKRNNPYNLICAGNASRGGANCRSKHAMYCFLWDIGDTPPEYDLIS